MAVSQTRQSSTREVIERFNEAFRGHDAAAVAARWREWFARNPDAQFEAEEMIASGGRAVAARLAYVKG
jgi:hypothetical protein